MPKNKNTTSPWMTASKKIKSKKGKTLHLNNLDFPKDPQLVEVTAAGKKPKKKKTRLKKFTKKQHKREIAAAAKKSLTYLDSLPLCKTVEEVEAWLLNGNATFQELALKSASRKKLPSDQLGDLVTLVTSQGATSEPILLDPGIQLSAFHQLHESFVAVSHVSDQIEFALITIIEGQFETSHQDTLLDLYGIKESGRRKLSKMSANYFAVVEPALFNSPKHPSGGRLVSPHVHAIIWGVDVVAKARAEAKKLNKTITPNATGADPVDVKRVDPDPVNLARMAAYLVKSQDKCKTFYPGKDGKAGNIHHSRKPDRPIRYQRLAEIRSMLTFRDVTFASGEGNAVRSGIAKSLSILAQEQARKAGACFHPAEIPSFWCKLKIAMGTTLFNHPIIKRTK